MFIHAPVQFQELDVVTLPSGRTYTTPEGVGYPSITTVLSVQPHDELDEWRERVGDKEADEITYRAANRGEIVHKIFERYINNEPDFLDHDEIMPYHAWSFEKVQKILDRDLNVVYAQEAPLYSHTMGVAGRVDLVGIYRGEPSIIDFKTSRWTKWDEWMAGYFMQETAYAVMWQELTGQAIKQIVTISAVDHDIPSVKIENPMHWVKPLREAIELYKNIKV